MIGATVGEETGARRPRPLAVDEAVLFAVGCGRLDADGSPRLQPLASLLTQQREDIATEAT